MDPINEWFVGYIESSRILSFLLGDIVKDLKEKS